MAENFGGMSRIIRHLEEEAVELEVQVYMIKRTMYAGS